MKHKKVIKGLGFTRLNQVVEREDTASIRGMVNAVPHLVRIVRVSTSFKTRLRRIKQWLSQPSESVRASLTGV